MKGTRWYRGCNESISRTEYQKTSTNWSCRYFSNFKLLGSFSPVWQQEWMSRRIAPSQRRVMVGPSPPCRPVACPGAQGTLGTSPPCTRWSCRRSCPQPSQPARAPCRSGPRRTRPTTVPDEGRWSRLPEYNIRRTSSVMMRLTHRAPVRGNEHRLRSLGVPSLDICSMVTTTRAPLDTRSMAPPIPFTFFPCSIDVLNKRRGQQGSFGIQEWSSSQYHRSVQDRLGYVIIKQKEAYLRDLERAQDGEIDMATTRNFAGSAKMNSDKDWLLPSDHRKWLRTWKSRRPRNRRDGLLS